MIDTIDDAMEFLAERVAGVAEDGNQAKRQRRNQVVDVFGMEFTRFGDANTPATFYLSISPDLIYYERFEFKIIVSPFIMPIGNLGATNASSVIVNPTSLGTSGAAITPNPHDHNTQTHTHNVTAGATLFPSTLTNATLSIEGIDITPYLIAQHPDPWVSGEGIYPGSGNANYDILDVASQLPAWQQGAILQPGYKKVEFTPNGVCNVTFVLYCKYSHTNR